MYKETVHVTLRLLSLTCITYWAQVPTSCEVKNHNNGVKQNQSFMEIAGKTLCILATQEMVITHLRSTISLTVFDLGGSITTHVFNIHHSSNKLLHILLEVSLADYSVLSSDMSIEWDEKDIELVNEKVMLDDEEIIVVDGGNLVPENETAELEEEEDQTKSNIVLVKQWKSTTPLISFELGCLTFICWTIFIFKSYCVKCPISIHIKLSSLVEHAV